MMAEESSADSSSGPCVIRTRAAFAAGASSSAPWRFDPAVTGSEASRPTIAANVASFTCNLFMDRPPAGRQLGLHVKLANLATIVGLLLSNPVTAGSKLYEADELAPAAKAARVRITQGPELESADDSSAIIRWKSDNPGGSDEHYGIVHFGTSPKDLNQQAKSHIRLNQTHSYTVFRVRVAGLAPRTKYYYTVDSMEANGRSDGVKSPVRQFTTSGPGERVAADRRSSTP
jgi:hypothetical protein